jgi:uncharacterized membrane protein
LLPVKCIFLFIICGNQGFNFLSVAERQIVHIQSLLSSLPLSYLTNSKKNGILQLLNLICTKWYDSAQCWVRLHTCSIFFSLAYFVVLTINDDSHRTHISTACSVTKKKHSRK